MQTQLQLGRYIHACLNETHSSKSTRFNPYFGRYNYKQHNPAKVGIKSCRFAGECVSFKVTGYRKIPDGRMISSKNFLLFPGTLLPGMITR